LILGGTAVWLAHETKGLLIGESANKEVVQSIRDMARQLSGVTHVNEVLTMHMGPDFILVNLSVDFRDGLTSEVVEECVATLDVAIKAKHPLVKRVFVEAEARWVSKAKELKSEKST
jgi:divalent metal cation (Fe/Co/Zn/Cd) transporter